ncbi:MFS transporter [Clostridium estertheticum]|uniref:MFS transporter n=1 Tax=Clostridium estertheticum TaxID=238834 RepID=UPI0013E93D42|nr:MFS transporter [Clostridium estertheticum]MBZ9687269.1 MFS transporter [Clostridium estertheticum]
MKSVNFYNKKIKDSLWLSLYFINNLIITGDSNRILVLPRSIYVVFFARIINSMGSFVHPFLTLFLTKSIGLGIETVGLFLMMAAFSSIPGSLIGGKLSDHVGRKKIIIIFQGLAALCLIPCAFLGKAIIII